MPTYSYHCKKCDHKFEKQEKICDRENSCKKPCPECKAKKSIEKNFEIGGIANPVGLGLSKPDHGFKEVVSRIREKTGQKMPNRFGY